MTAGSVSPSSLFFSQRSFSFISLVHCIVNSPVGSFVSYIMQNEKIATIREEISIFNHIQSCFYDGSIEIDILSQRQIPILINNNFQLSPSTRINHKYVKQRQRYQLDDRSINNLISKAIFSYCFIDNDLIHCNLRNISSIFITDSTFHGDSREMMKYETINVMIPTTG